MAHDEDAEQETSIERYRQLFQHLSDRVERLFNRMLLIFIVALVIAQAAMAVPDIRMHISQVDKQEGQPLSDYIKQESIR